MTKRTWHNQFTIDEDRPLSVPEYLLHQPWEDVSWGNEVCPRFINPSLAISVWVDYDLQEDRELSHTDWRKFTVNSILDIEEDILADESMFSAEDPVELENFILAYAKSVHSTAVLYGLDALLTLSKSDEETELIRGMLDDLALLTAL